MGSAAPHMGEARESVAILAQTLSCPVRIEVLMTLADGPQGIDEVAARLELDSKLVSHHLRTLRGRGLAQSSRQGHRCFYELSNHTTITQDGEWMAVALRRDGCELRVTLPSSASVSVSPAARRA